MTAGATSGFLAFLTTRLALRHPLGQHVSSVWKALFLFPLSGTIVCALCLLGLAAALSRWLYPQERAKKRAIEVLGTRFERMLFRGMEEQQMLGLRLNDGRYYIGWSIEAPNLNPRETFFRLLPVLIGFSATDSPRTLFFSLVNYDAALEPPGDEETSSLEQLAEKFSVLLRFDDVESATFATREDVDEIADGMLQVFDEDE